MKNKFVGLALVVILVIAISGLYFPQTKSVVKEVVGSVVGPELTGDYFSFGGFETVYKSQSFRTSTSTLCAIPFPSATSTLISVFVNPTTQDTTGGTLVIATSTTAYATTTAYFAPTELLKWQPVTWIASSTNATGQNKYLKPSAGYVVVDVAGKTSYDLRGKCYAEFRVFR